MHEFLAGMIVGVISAAAVFSVAAAHDRIRLEAAICSEIQWHSPHCEPAKAAWLNP